MLAFTCPLCNSAWPVPDGEPGRTASCPSCGRRVLIPPWAPVAELRAPTEPARTELPVPGVAVALAIGAVLVVGGVGAALWTTRQIGPGVEMTSAGRTAPTPAAVVPAASEKKAPTGPPSEYWTHAELLAHWRQHGLMLQARETDYASLYGPAQFVSERGPVSEAEAATLTKSKLPAGYAFVQRRKTAEEAEDVCRRTKGACFTWGRFYVTGDAGLLERLRRALP